MMQRNMQMTKHSLIQKIREAEFAKQEVILYLDTHPHDKKAMSYYSNIRDKCRTLTEEYEKFFGPLTASGVCSGGKWDWVDSPWPWQTCAAQPWQADAPQPWQTGCAMHAKEGK